jgi:N-acetylmuramoyl-L-alanine amidase-like protein
MKIVMSSGHGKYIRGASGYLDEVDEARRVVDTTAAFMREMGISVKTYHDDVSDDQSENLNRIVDFHNSQIRDLDISVHFNANATTSKPMGTECLYVSQEDLAREMSDAISTALGLPDRGPKYRSDLFFLNNTEEPAILIEVCFVDSSADARAYEENFDDCCEAIAEVFGESGGGEAPEPPEQAEGFYAKGRCSHFGGPDDTGVEPSEGLAFIYDYEDAPHLFLPDQPSGTTGLARRLNPNVFYVACRWDYEVTPKEMLANPSLLALVRAKGKSFHVWPADWGPHGDTKRVADLSPGLMQALDLTTDDEVEVIYPAP